MTPLLITILIIAIPVAFVAGYWLGHSVNAEKLRQVDAQLKFNEEKMREAIKRYR